MSKIDIEIKILDDRIIKLWGPPTYQTDLAAAIDLYACIDKPIKIKPGNMAQLLPSGISIHMNNNSMMAMILPRSGLGHKKGLVLGNTAGVIDADYSGPILISVWNRNSVESKTDICISPGERIAQMIFLPIIRPNFKIVENFSFQNPRGEGGFGSTDK
ncbi:dUTP pyrophosphatase [Candidatus Kinetoplastibacterium blastocrithidii TCC012E]|uniref:dUTP diphosphatase n=1 Tax=Candidatus Kinetoplastidibacterium blastocrithidiae TCC012E TaxID=1208922 RepID=M1LB22_9PROT|nr:dUTP diphosphatase [Candidatus Kinetoplastibacterium blastocrithidii]AGF49663.1 dUTP pyrophosphatase [Candidatus Kinetoplastibacterium blastocrithidii TCC012E]